MGIVTKRRLNEIFHTSMQMHSHVLFSKEKESRDKKKMVLVKVSKPKIKEKRQVGLAARGTPVRIKIENKKNTRKRRQYLQAHRISWVFKEFSLHKAPFSP